MQTMPSYIHYNIQTSNCTHFNFVALLSGIYKCVSTVSNDLNSVPPPDGGIGAALVVYVDQQYRGFRESRDYGTLKQFTFPRTAAEIGER